MRDYKTEPMKFQLTMVVDIDGEVELEELTETIDNILIENVGFDHYFQDTFSDPLGHVCIMDQNKIKVKLKSDENGEEPTKVLLTMVVNVHEQVEPAELKLSVETLLKDMDLVGMLLAEIGDALEIGCELDKITVKMLSD